MSTPAAPAGAGVSVLEKAAPASDNWDDLDDILGEIAAPPPAKAADDFDDILGELGAPDPAPAKPVDDFDDILGELAAPVAEKPADDFDDILGELAAPEPAKPTDDLDDILGELAAPEPAKPPEAFDDILGELAAPTPAKAEDDFHDILGVIAGPAPAAPIEELDDMLGEAAAATPVEPSPRKRPKTAKSQPDAAIGDPAADVMPPESLSAPEPAAGEAEAAIAAPPAAGRKGLLAALRPNLAGTRQVSRKAHAAMQAAIVVLGLTAAAEAAVILTRPAHGPVAAGHAQPQVVKVTVIPVDYAKVDLERYLGKVRILREGGRDMLRHPKVEAAVVGLDGGEQLYKELLSIADQSAPADRMTIRDDRVTIASCDGPICGDRKFRLVYDIRHDRAAVCTTERYPDGSLGSYGYSVSGNSAIPHC